MKRTLLALFLAVLMLLSMATPALAKDISFAPIAEVPSFAEALGVDLVADAGTNDTDPKVLTAGGNPISFAPAYEEDALPPLAYPTDKEAPALPDAFSRVAAQFEDDDMVTFIVATDKAPLLDRFTVDEIAENVTAVAKYEAEQMKRLDDLQTVIEGRVGSEDGFEMGYRYTVASTAVAVKTTYGNKAALEALPGVSIVYLAPTFKVPTYVESESLEVLTNNASTMIGANTVNETGYTGTGMRVAILDTGIVVDHPAFTALPEEKLTASSLTVEEIESVWDTLNAKALGANRASSTYRSTKIPFAFNYASGNLDVSHAAAQSDHGTHVAGIAAGNRTDESVGVAPDAQLIVMQVFDGSGASWDTIMAALEDCVRLNVDACNLSLGSAAGFTDNDPIMNEIMNKFKETDIEVLIASGNDTDAAYQNLTGTNMSLSSNPDIGLAGTPSTYSSAISVASADNDGELLLYFTVAGQNIGYRDTATTSATRFISNFSEATLEFVMVPGYGDVSDYEGLDVAGKVAVVSRGVTSFPEKQAAAQAAGAVAVVVYNNAAGVINMQINDGEGNIPAVSISQKAGAYMAEQYAAGVNTMTVCKVGEPTLIKNDKVLSDFSSWGVTPDLKLKPEVTGVGGNIYSSVDPEISGAGAWYGTMSGTSMATPQVTGAMAVLMQYLRTEYPAFTDATLRTVAANIMMSTATPIEVVAGLEYSPRGQGAGLIDLVKATTTKGYLSTTTASEGRPKAELGDDDAKTGVYTFPFVINNISDETLTYSFDTSVLTSTYSDGLISSTPYKLSPSDVTMFTTGVTEEFCYDYNDDGAVTTADASILLRHITGVETFPREDAHYAYLDVNGDAVVDVNDVRILTDYCAEMSVLANVQATFSMDREYVKTEIEVPAGETQTVYVTITLSDEDKLYMDQFENGIYVEGFVYVNALDEGNADLTLPFVGFYGDWSAAPIFDSEDPAMATQYPRYVFTYYSTLGTNPYFQGGRAGDAYNAVSAANPLAEIDAGMLRNAKKLEFTAVDNATGEEYFYVEGEWIPKSYYQYAYGMIVPFWVTSDEGELWNGYTDKNGDPIADNTRVTYTCNAWLDDGDDIMDETWSFEITVDNQYPQIVNANALQVVKGGTEEAPQVLLPLQFMENHHIAAVMFVNDNGVVMGKYEIENTPGELCERTFDITGYGSNFTIVVADYACNETELDVVLDLGELTTVRPTIKDLDNDSFYACEIARVDAVAAGWIKANKFDLSGLSNENFDTTNLYYSAEYVNGYVIAQRTDGDIVLLTPYSTYWDSRTLIENTSGEPGEEGTIVLYDMALDYVGYEGADNNEHWWGGNDRLFAVGWQYTDTDGDGTVDGYNALFEIMMTPSGYSYIQEIGKIGGVEIDYYGSEMLTLACTTDGVLYGIDTMGILYTIDKTATYNEETWENEVLATGVAVTDFGAYIGAPNVIQAMTYDHNTGYMYWAGHTSTSVNGNVNTTSYMMVVDLETGECIILGSDEAYAGWYNSGCTSLFIPNDLESDLFTVDVPPTRFSVSPYETTMTIGQRKLLDVSWEPWNAQVQTITWASSDESIATVNAAGLVLALSAGEVEITATAQVYDEWGYDTPDGQPGWYERTNRCTITVVPSAEEIYGFVIQDYKIQANNFTWFKYSDQNLTDLEAIAKPMVSVEDMDGNLVETEALWQGGAYYNGYVYTVMAQSWSEGGYRMSGTALYRSPVDPAATPVIGAPELVGRSAGIEVGNIGFDYNTGRMYGADETNGGLCIVDLDTGSVDALCEYTGDLNPTYTTAMCVTADSTIVIADMDGNLYTVDPDTGACTRIGSCGVETQFYGGMMYDYNTGNIYWNPCMNAGQSPLYLVVLGQDEWDPDRMAAQCVKIGSISTKSGVEQTVLFTIPENEPETKFVAVESLTITNGDLIGLVGGTTKLVAATTPARPTVQRKVWTSDNETVATVDNQGIVSFHDIGNAVITATLTDKDEKVYSDSINVTVKESGGKLVGFVTEDAVTSHGNNYVDIFDYDIRNFMTTTYVTGMYTLNVGEYFDGYYYGYDQDGNFIRANAEEPKSFTVLGKVTGLEMDEYSDRFDFVVNMAYDYVNGRMLAVTYRQLLAEVNLDTGALSVIGNLTGEKAYTLAVDMNGTMYAAGDGVLSIINPETYVCEFVAELGVDVDTHPYYGANFTPQMAYEATTNRLYINATVRYSGSSQGRNNGMLMIDLETLSMINLGKPALNRGLQPTKVGDMYLGLLTAIPDAAEIPVSPVNGVMISGNVARVALGGTYALEAHVRPTFAESQEIVWSTSDATIASVDEATGLVTGVAAGTATITATNPASGKSASCAVTVVDPETVKGLTAYTISADQSALLKFNPELPGSTVETVFAFRDGTRIGGLTMGDECLYYSLDSDYYGSFPGIYRLDLTSGVSTFIGGIYCYSTATNDIYFDMADSYLYTVDGYYVKRFDPTVMVTTELNYVVNEIDTSNLYGWDANDNYFSEFYSQNAGVVYVNGDLYTIANNTYNGTILGKYTDADLTSASYARVAVLDEFSVQDDACALDYCEATGLFYVVDASGYLWSFDATGENVTKIGALGEGIDFNGLAIVNS